MPCQTHPESVLRALPPGKYAWGCCIRHTVSFTYIYGPVPAYLAAINTPNCGDHLHKGEYDTLAEAQAAAEERARELALVFEGVGSVRALPAEAYLDELIVGRADTRAPYPLA